MRSVVRGRRISLLVSSTDPTRLSVLCEAVVRNRSTLYGVRGYIYYVLTAEHFYR